MLVESLGLRVAKAALASVPIAHEVWLAAMLVEAAGAPDGGSCDKVFTMRHNLAVLTRSMKRLLLAFLAPWRGSSRYPKGTCYLYKA